jgi:two-component system response regulator (stage 0 sporulation protein F)
MEQVCAENSALAPGRRPSLLVVDDNEGICEIIEVILGDRFEVMRARDALEALLLLDHIHPAVVFLDVMMPGINGLRLLREIRQMRLDTRVVMITVSINEDIREEALRLGVDAFFIKPFDIGEIRGAADRLRSVAMSIP